MMEVIREFALINSSESESEEEPADASEDESADESEDEPAVEPAAKPSANYYSNDMQPIKVSGTKVSVIVDGKKCCMADHEDWSEVGEDYVPVLYGLTKNYKF